MPNNHSVLVIDDDDAVVAAILRKFKGLDFDVTVAHDGIEALEQMNTQVFDVVLADLHMPKKNGVEVLKERKATKNADTPVYVFTNLGSDNYCEQAKQNGAVECFVKSRITLSEVVAIINKAIA